MAFGPLAYRLLLTLALGAAGTAGLAVGILAALAPGIPAWSVPICAALTGAGTYGMAYALLRRRLAAAKRAVVQIASGSFEPPGQENTRGRRDELHALMQEIVQAGLRVQRTLRERERLEHYRREFLGNVSHELKTPIFSIRGFADTLLDGALEDDAVRHSFVQKIQHNAVRLGNLAEDLAEVARIEMGELTMTMEAFSLQHLMREVAESTEPLAASRQVTLRQTTAQALPLVRGDRERIRQVLSNLVDNAVKYNRAGGQVEVGARLLPTKQIKVSVADDGIGIAPEHVGRLTERFFRAEPSRSRREGGTGLGLAIVKHILNAHGSQLMIESRMGRGSTFGFSLPVATGSDQAHPH